MIDQATSAAWPPTGIVVLCSCTEVWLVVLVPESHTIEALHIDCAGLMHSAGYIAPEQNMITVYTQLQRFKWCCPFWLKSWLVSPMSLSHFSVFQSCSSVYHYGPQVWAKFLSNSKSRWWSYTQDYQVASETWSRPGMMNHFIHSEFIVFSQHWQQHFKTYGHIY